MSPKIGTVPVDEILSYMVNYLEICLFELDEARPTDREDIGFIKGERTAYVECMEMIQLCVKYKELGLDFDIAGKYLRNR